ncbi:unnamed protein product [Rhizophagus irregularis]|nr:unnamed protein product [Rhizophagus irregularis]CAB4429402.1 unnamed protein product [Rhizophagus irregularis]
MLHILQEVRVDQKSTKQAVEQSIATGINIEKIWKSRNLKEIYRGKKKQKKKEELQKEDKKRTEERQDEHDEENLIEPLFETPPQRVFSELDGISKYQNTKISTKVV